MGTKERLKLKQKVEKIELLDLEAMKPHIIDMKTPEVVFKLLVDSDCVIFGRHIASSKVKGTKLHFSQKYDIALRPYQSPTCLDEKLAFVMANMALIKAGDIVYDPFFGSGSTGIAAAYFGAFVYGSDIDLRVLNGTKIGRKSYKPEVLSKVEETKENFDVFTNFMYYRQP